MRKFKTGDAVRIKSGLTKDDMGIHFCDFDVTKTYHVSRRENDSYQFKEEKYGFWFNIEWLVPAGEKAKFEFREKGLGIERVLFNDPATIVFWTDGTKTVVKCRKGDEWDAEKGLAMACAKKLMGNRGGYHKTLATHYKKERAWEEEMDTEQIRAAVSYGCRGNHGCCSACPCNPLKGRTCYIIVTADREELITMLKEFEAADKWNYEDWRMCHA